mgnify:FL=1
MKRVFLISTVGQAKNAIALAKRLPRPETQDLFIVLYTVKSPQVVQAKSFLQSFNAEIAEIALPRMPNSGFPTVVKKVLRAYLEILDKEKVKELWIANINTHYAMISSYLQTNNSAIYFYEDGLGSYKNYQELLSYKSPTLIFWDWVRGFFGELKKISKRLVKTHKRLFWVTGVAFFSMQWVRWLCGRLLPPPYCYYYRLHSKFKSVYVSFPDQLDPQVYNGEINSFDYMKTNREIAKIHQDTKRLFIEKTSVSSSIFISQVYGSGTKKWYSTVARVLASYDNELIYVKFHPKESFENRAFFIEELSKSVAEVIDIDPENTSDANDIIAEVSFSKIFGLTSSSLIYALKSYSSLPILSLAPTLLQEMRKDPSLTVEYLQLRKDFDTYSRFFKS